MSKDKAFFMFSVVFSVLMLRVTCMGMVEGPSEDFKPLLVSSMEQGEVGEKLQESMIWAELGDEIKDKRVFVGFRKEIELDDEVEELEVHIFADSRYLLWVNGEYVHRGPCRFDPVGPEYDSIEVSETLFQ